MALRERDGGVQLARAVSVERAMLRIRWAVVAFAVVQVLTYYQPYPPGAMSSALAVVALLAIGNACLHVAVRGLAGVATARRLSVAALALDWLAVMSLVFVYTFDPDTAMWAVLYLLPLEGAIRFQLKGAIWTMASAAVAYLAREVYGAVTFGTTFYATSVSYRMGIGFFIAAVAGVMARSLVREREDLERAKAEVEEVAQRLEAANAGLVSANAVKDDFLAMTNHEVRTPLTTVLGYTATLRLRWDDLTDTQRREFIERIETQGERLLGLVEAMLTLSTAQEGALRLRLAPVRVADVARAAVDESGAPPDSVELRCPPDLQVLADAVRLRQVLTNLLANASKYGAPPILLAARERHDGVEISVTDHGPGVPGEFVAQMFDRFTRAGDVDSRPGGVGLGLAIVRQLVEAQDGRVWYESHDGSGARFCVLLPAVPAPAPVPEATGDVTRTGP